MGHALSYEGRLDSEDVVALDQGHANRLTIAAVEYCLGGGVCTEAADLIAAALLTTYEPVAWQGLIGSISALDRKSLKMLLGVVTSRWYGVEPHDLVGPEKIDALIWMYAGSVERNKPDAAVPSVL